MSTFNTVEGADAAAVALRDGFSWDASPQGYDYWVVICEEIREIAAQLEQKELEVNLSNLSVGHKFKFVGTSIRNDEPDVIYMRVSVVPALEDYDAGDRLQTFMNVETSQVYVSLGKDVVLPVD